MSGCTLEAMKYYGMSQIEHEKHHIKLEFFFAIKQRPCEALKKLSVIILVCKCVLHHKLKEEHIGTG